ncbi:MULTISPECIES: hypothetical protein [Lacrimispora]|uniref:Uncharacterized protein n=1 Tax=[Clostridium] celerecrescens 18A TaxID=1286362 RepID=A0A2M8Z2Y5_9FIRM|nr:MULTISPECIES: hypothetical protein [Lacrimispora]PJJ27817.1 hypothetical protein H171_1296 [[Clostridium] celerecrescens 18A]
MPTEIMVALISLAGSGVGAFIGILASAKLTNYRLEQLEKKVDKHNTVIERTFRLEEQMKVANHRIADLEEKGD